LQGLKKITQLKYTKDIGGSQMELGGITQTIYMLEPIGIEVDNVLDKITFGQRSNTLELNLSKDNMNELGQKMFPQGLIPDDFHKKIALMNQLIEELEDIRDKDNPDWELKSVYYVGGDVDSTFFDTKEVQ
jgi:hypothetical protein